MDSDAFTVRCGDCGRNVTIRSVSEFHNVGGFCGYSYIYACECGSRVAVDGCDGDDIPTSMKLAAASRRHAHNVLRTIDFHRRSLPQSNAKIMLKNARLDVPEPLGNDVWLPLRGQLVDVSQRLASACADQLVWHHSLRCAPPTRVLRRELMPATNARCC
jgi:hypothetical protein